MTDQVQTRLDRLAAYGAAAAAGDERTMRRLQSKRRNQVRYERRYRRVAALRSR